MRLTVSLEGATEGRVLTSIDLEDVVKMTTTDDIEKSNFNKDMFKACTDSAYECGYEKGKADAIDEVRNKMFSMPAFLTVDNVMKILDELKEQSNV